MKEKTRIVNRIVIKFTYDSPDDPWAKHSSLTSLPTFGVVGKTAMKSFCIIGPQFTLGAKRKARNVNS